MHENIFVFITDEKMKLAIVATVCLASTGLALPAGEWCEGEGFWCPSLAQCIDTNIYCKSRKDMSCFPQNEAGNRLELCGPDPEDEVPCKGSMLCRKHNVCLPVESYCVLTRAEAVRCDSNDEDQTATFNELCVPKPLPTTTTPIPLPQNEKSCSPAHVYCRSKNICISQVLYCLAGTITCYGDEELGVRAQICPNASPVPEDESGETENKDDKLTTEKPEPTQTSDGSDPTEVPSITELPATDEQQSEKPETNVPEETSTEKPEMTSAKPDLTSEQPLNTEPVSEATSSTPAQKDESEKPETDQPEEPVTEKPEPTETADEEKPQ